MADEPNLISLVYNRLPCLGCTNSRCDPIKARIGWLALQLLDGNPPQPLPTMPELMFGCCQKLDDPAYNRSLTFVMPGQLQQPPPDRPARRRW